MSKYQPQQFEKKWREKWSSDKLNDFVLNQNKQPYYNLVELPYTSGDLHIGHWFTFTIPDVLSRYKRMAGWNVFFPIGYDAFGLPAENAAIKRHIHPRDWTMKNIETMTAQFQTMGTMLNWKDVVIACLPEYYRWNQWIFIKMFERGLAYRGKMLSNWCETDQTVLANENIENGNCWRCGNPVVQKEVEQWFLKITDYADKLVWPQNPKQDWPMSVRVGQNNWIGKKTGINIVYPVLRPRDPNFSGTELPLDRARGQTADSSKFVPSDFIDEITCFTTAPVNFGMTFIVLAPEHQLVQKIIKGEIKVDPKIKAEIETYVKKSLTQTQLQRVSQTKEKTGVFTGLHALNRIAGWEVPVWVSDFVVGEVGTGAVQGCPAHDYKDFEFAKKFKIPIKRVVVGPDGDTSPVEREEQIIVKGMPGKMINSKFLDGLDFTEGLQKTMDYVEEKGWGKRVVTYHLHDWSVSRQRYWGTPVPMIHCDRCGIVPVPEKDLPVELPYKVDFTPKGKPPLATNEEWLNTTCPKCGKPAKRDAETLDTFFDSAWYWFRYLSPHYEKGPFDKEIAKKLTPVDVYFGGSEHTLGHTLYARFFTKFFKDLGLVDYDEFAKKRIQHGVVLGPDGNRMSKSKGNVINPDDVVGEYGTDAVRMYLCFMMPYEATGPWSDKTIAGVYRFLKRVWEKYQAYFVIASEAKQSQEIASSLDAPRDDKVLVSKLQKTIEKVGSDIEKIKMNTAIAAMMEFLNAWEDTVGDRHACPVLNIGNAKKFLKILAPFAPHLTEEIWCKVFGEKESIHLSSWPQIDEKAIVIGDLKIPVQINGKVRAVVTVTVPVPESAIVKKALEDKKIKVFTDGKQYKVIYIQGKILNFVI